jgi:hypothetical protein
MNEADDVRILEDQRRKELEERRYREAITWLMNDKRGRLFVYRQLESAGIYRISYTGNADTNFREGGRNEGLRLLATVEEYCPGSYLKMLRENRLKGAGDGA